MEINDKLNCIVESVPSPMSVAPSTWEGNRNRKHAEMWCCGRNDHGQLGTGTMTEKLRELPPNTTERKEHTNIEERKAIEWCPFSELLSPIQGASTGSLHSIMLTQDNLPSHVATVSLKKNNKITK